MYGSEKVVHCKYAKVIADMRPKGVIDLAKGQGELA